MADHEKEVPGTRVERRAFLKGGLLAAGAATCTLSGLVHLRHSEGHDQKNAPGPGPDTCAACSKAAEAPAAGPTSVAMTPEGKLVRIPADAAACCAPPQAPAAARQGVPGRKWVMVIDLSKCDGCKKCTEACQKMHFTPPEREWVKVFKMQDGPEEAPYWFPKPCFQCDNPPCTKVCPVDATFKRQDGVVLIDNERCIGCRFCMAACPYSTRFFNWKKPENPPEAGAQPYSPEHGYPRRVGTVEKCDFCPDMLSQGRLPACASGCPMGVIYFGDQNEDAVTNSKGETVRLSRFVRDNAGYRFLQELGTEPRVYYLPPKGRMFPAPGEKKESDPK
jgi:molybdopterin-containing oxidoreductase family iron-sulfur binding subunit